MDELDFVCHPMHSELNFPIGDRNPLDFGIRAEGRRWQLPSHLWEGIFAAPTQSLPKWLRNDEYAEDVLRRLNHALQAGFRRGTMQRRPHVTLVSPEYYRLDILPVIIDWVLLLLKQLCKQTF